jgi:hypothetical protein
MRLALAFLVLTGCEPDLTINGDLNLRFSRAWSVECLSEQNEVAVVVVAMSAGNGRACLPEGTEPDIPSRNDCDTLRSIYADRCRPNVGPIVGTRASIAAWFTPQALDITDATITGSANGLWLAECERNGTLETYPVAADLTLLVTSDGPSTIQVDGATNTTTGNFEARHCELD